MEKNCRYGGRALVGTDTKSRAVPSVGEPYKPPPPVEGTIWGGHREQEASTEALPNQPKKSRVSNPTRFLCARFGRGGFKGLP